MKKKIMISGMSCNHCVDHVKEALLEMPGVTQVEVNLDNKYAIIDFKYEVKNENINQVIDEAGYDVVNIENI